MMNITRRNKIIGLSLCALLVLGAVLYSVYWFQASNRAVQAYLAFMAAHNEKAIEPAPPLVSGFPGRIRLFVPHDSFLENGARIEFSDLEIIGWPAPGIPIAVNAGAISITPYGAPVVVRFDTFGTNFIYFPDRIEIQNADLSNGDFKLGVRGTVVYEDKVPLLDLMVTMENHTAALDTMLEAGFIEPKAAMWINAGLGVFRDTEGHVRVPLTTTKNGRIMAGPIPLGRL